MGLIQKIENSQYKITVEEISEFKYIATFWQKSYCLEVDREVFEFESFGGAAYKALELTCKILPD